jgi:endonuclease/exonuclease/phosphatase family metal-dependent hydrolase
MAKAFSVLSWNIEHLKGTRPGRVDKVVDVLVDEDPDIFGLYEIEGRSIYQEIASRMPGYSFHITEGPQTQEILVGARHSLTSFFSQRVTFKSGNNWLRPGAMLTVKLDGEDYVLMFLHLKSHTTPIGLGVRDDQFARLFKLKKKLDKVTDGDKRANFIALGDFNTMGMDYRGRSHDIPATAELEKLDKDMKRNSVLMRRLMKTAPNTWSNGSLSSYSPSDLDHVVASKHLKFASWDNKAAVNEGVASAAGQSEVDVRGWVDSATVADQDAWIDALSDHSYLYFEVEKVE